MSPSSTATRSRAETGGYGIRAIVSCRRLVRGTQLERSSSRSSMLEASSLTESLHAERVTKSKTWQFQRMRVWRTLLRGAPLQVVQKLLKTPVPPMRADSPSATPLKADYFIRKGRKACAIHKYIQSCYEFGIIITIRWITRSLRLQYGARMKIFPAGLKIGPSTGTSALHENVYKQYFDWTIYNYRQASRDLHA